MARMLLVALFATMALAYAAPAADSSTTPVAILKYESDGPNPDGSYHYAVEAADQSHFAESGTLKHFEGPQSRSEDGEASGDAVVKQGSYGFVGDDGVHYEVKYVADENGFHPEGAHLPVAPAIPEGILRALEYIKAHPQPEEEQH